MYDKFISIFLGISLVAFGAGVLLWPKFYDHILSFSFDYSGYNIPFGIFMIIVGLLFIWTTLKKKKKND